MPKTIPSVGRHAYLRMLEKKWQLLPIFRVAAHFCVALNLFLIIFGAVFLHVLAPVSAQSNDTLNFQARLLTSSGSIVPDGTYNVEFKLYDQPTAGTALWTETRTHNTDAANLHITVKSGYLSAYLGDKTSFPSTIDWNDQHYLTMNIGGTTATPTWDGEMTPRIRLTSVPFAFAAEHANTATSIEDVQGSNTGTLQFDTLTTDRDILLPNASGTVALLQNAQTFSGAITFGASNTGLSVTNDASIGGTLTTDSLSVSNAATIDGNLTVGTDTLFIDTAANRVGVGTTSPAARFDVTGGANEVQLRVRAYSTQTSDMVRLTDSAGNLITGFNNTGNLFYTNSGFRGVFDQATLTEDRLYTLPDANGTLCLTSGNCAGVGGQIGGDGTAGRIAVFSTAADIEDSYLLQDINGLMLDDGKDLVVNTDTLFVDATNGRVGIGTATPGYKLDVVGGTGVVVARFSGRVIGEEAVNGDEFVTLDQLEGAVGATGAFTQGGNDFGELAVLGTTDNFGLQFITNNLTRLTIADDGDITIANALSVGDTLSVTGAATFSSTLSVDDTLTVTAGGMNITGDSVVDGTLTGLTGLSSDGNIDFASLNAGGMVFADVTTGRLRIATSGTDYEVPLTFENGLVRTGDSIALGGTLTEDTELNLDGHVFNFTGGNVGIGTSGSPGSLLSVGGTTGNFTVDSAGAVTAVGVNAGAGLLQGSGGLTIEGSSSFDGNVEIIGSNTFTVGTGATTLGDSLDVTGQTTFNDTITVDAGLGIVATFSGRVAGADAEENNEFVTLGQANTDYQTAGNYFIQGGNTFAATAILGTADAHGLDIQTDSTTRLSVSATGNVAFDTDTLFVDAGNNRVQVGSSDSVNARLSVIGGTDQTQLLVRANATQSFSNPLVLLQDSAGGELARINATASSLYFGYEAGGSTASGANNIGIGASALGAVSTGTANTTLGSGALASVSIGSSNTAVGYNAGNLLTGSNNILLGYQAGSNLTDGDNNIIIGHDLDASSATVSNELRIGGILQGDLTTLAAQLNGSLEVAGETTLQDNLTIAAGGINVTGASTFDGNLEITGVSTLTVGTGATTLGGSLDVTGQTTLNDTITVDAGLGIVATFSGRVAGADAEENNEFVTLGQANTDYQTAGDYFIQDGNDFGELAVLGTTDNFGLQFITNNVARLTIADDGDISIANALSVGDTLSVTGAATFSSTLSVDDTLTVTAGGMNITGDSVVDGTLTGLTGLSSDGNIDFASLNAGGMVFADVTTGRLRIATSGTDYEVPLTFENGLVRTGDSIALGGTLTEDTELNLDGHVFNFTGGNVGIGTSGSPGSLLSVGGTTGNFTVDSAGAVTAVGVNAGAGLLQGSGGLTIEGSSSFDGNVEIIGSNTFTVGTGATTLGGSLDVTGQTTFNDTITVDAGLGIVATFSGRVAGADAEENNEFITLGQANTDYQAAGSYFIQGGNDFGGTTAGVLGMTSNESLSFITNNLTRLTVDAGGDISINNALTVGAGLVVSSGGADITGAVTLQGNTEITDANTFTVGTGATTLGGTLDVAGQVTASSFITTGRYEGSADDTVNAPSFTWTDDTDTGMFQPAADVLGFAAGGIERLRVDSDAFNIQGIPIQVLNSGVGTYDNFIDNPGFESGGINDGWLSNADYSIESTTVRTGNYAATATSTGVNLLKRHYIDIPASEGDSFYGSVWLRSVGADGHGGLLFHWLAKDKSTVSSSSVGLGTFTADTWNQRAGTATAPAGTAYLRVFIRIGALTTGVAHKVDDVYITKNMTLPQLDVNGALSVTGNAILTGTLAVSTLGTADSDAVLCRNSSNQLAACNSTFATSAELDTAFVQGGNSFTATATLGTNDAHDLVLETSGAERLRLAADGSYVRLQESTALQLSGNSNSVIRYQDSDSGMLLGNYAAGGFTFIQSGRLQFQNTNDYSVNFEVTNAGHAIFKPRTDSTTAFQVQNAGGGSTVFNVDTTNQRVGIATESPAARLHVAGVAGGSVPGISGQTIGLFSNTVLAASNASVSILSGNTGQSRIFFGDTDSETAGRIQYDHSDNSLRLNVNASEVLRILSNGNVGIGTTGADARLHVQGTADQAQLIVQGHSTQTSNLFQLKNSTGTVMAGVTGDGILKVGTTAAPTLGGAKLLVTEMEVITRLRIGDATNGMSFNDEVSGQLRFRGTARPTRDITLNPEFPGAVLTGDGSNNTGTMTSAFCSGTNRRNINTTICGADDEHNYYSWTAQATNDYDVYVRYQLPSDFDGFGSDDSIKMWGWRTTSSEKVEFAVFNEAGNQCGTTTEVNSANTTWQQTALAGNETTDVNCNTTNMAPGSIITIRMRMTVGSNNNFALGGAISFDYRSKF